MPTSPAARIARLLQGWENAPGQLGGRLSAAIADLIEHGDIGAGDRLPSERGLAAALSVSRGTVAEAYARLREDGWISSRAGSGSFASAERGGDAIAVPGDARLSTFGGRTREHVDLSSGAPGGLPMVARAMAGLDADLVADLVAGDGYHVQGLADLRRALGTYYADLGVPTEAEQILVTSGSQQALKLIAEALVGPDDTVVVEDPSYRGALDVFRSRRARLVPVPVESDGPDLRVLERVVEHLRPRLVYLLPAAHNPTGSVVSRHKARRLAEILGHHGTLLVEDGSPADLVFAPEGPPPPVGAALDPAQWIAVGSASKVFWGGLRVGWIRADEAMVQSLARTKAVEDLGSSVIGQLLTADCLREVAAARAARRAQLGAGLRTAVETLQVRAPEWSWTEPAGGSALWVRLPGTDTTAFAQVARRNGISIVPGPVFSSVDGFQDHLRIPFWREPDELEAGLARLVRLWRADRGGHRASGARPPVPRDPTGV
ncbi:PLP-dependent aminotransferase family protein [Actinomadura sp. LOL_016]|uniref:aminotransferase-like domain-containing protein n=1 Tax=unclassified Actinomadura TaxID=2626254 RepID=UPI003A8005DB